MRRRIDDGGRLDHQVTDPDIIAQAMWASAMIRTGRGPLVDPPGGLHWAGAALPRTDLMLSVL
jgi:hypothetical protein